MRAISSARCHRRQTVKLTEIAAHQRPAHWVRCAMTTPNTTNSAERTSTMPQAVDPIATPTLSIAS
jgi:hypothetical protein